MYRTKWGRKQGNMVQYIGFDKILYMASTACNGYVWNAKLSKIRHFAFDMMML